MTAILLVLVAAGFIVLAALGVGVVVLIKMGVITKYALKEEPHDQGDYELDQSHEVKD
jgi:uncharacterized membrane protein